MKHRDSVLKEIKWVGATSKLNKMDYAKLERKYLQKTNTLVRPGSFKSQVISFQR